MRHLILFSFLFICFESRAEFLESLFSQTVAKPIFVEQNAYEVTPAIGYGSYPNSFSVQELDWLSHTNTNYFIFGLDINRSSSHFYIPNSDSRESTKSRVDSDVFRFQTSFKMTPHWTLEALYSKTFGFYSGDVDNIEKPLKRFPELGVKKFGFTATFFKDETHSSTMFSPIAYRAVETGSSLFYGFELSRHELRGLNTINSYLKNPATDPIFSADNSTAMSFIGWSQSKMYEQFFWSYAVGIGAGASYILEDFSNRNATDVLIATTVPAAGTFGWVRNGLVLGAYMSVRTWTAKVVNLELSNSNGHSGLYLAYQF